MATKTTWNVIYEFLVELVDEFLARGVVEWYRGLRGQGTTAVKTEVGTTGLGENITAEQRQESAAILWGAPRILKSSRDNFITIHKTMTPKYQERFEIGMAKLLKQLKDGIWRAGTETFIERIKAPSRSQQPQPSTERRTERPLYEHGWNPAGVYIRMINQAGKSPEDVRSFIEWVLQEEGQLWNEVGDFLKKEASTIAKTAREIVLAIFFLYVAFVPFFGWLAYSKFNEFGENPNNTMLLVQGIISLCLLFGLLYIPLKPFLKEEERIVAS